MEKIISISRTIMNLFLETLFPSKCIGCHKNYEILCDKCISELKTTERQTEDNIFAIFDYQDKTVKDSIWKLKYHNSKYLGQKMGELMCSYLLEETEELRIFSQGLPIYILPVPISKNRKRFRGYNQSEILAKNFCNYLSDKNFQFRDDLVYKNKDTLPQAKITNKNIRLKNIKGVFDIKKGKEIKGRTIIVIDDVTTTGGTLGEIIRILKKSGAKKVVGYAFAH